MSLYYWYGILCATALIERIQCFYGNINKQWHDIPPTALHSIMSCQSLSNRPTYFIAMATPQQ